MYAHATLFHRLQSCLCSTAPDLTIRSERGFGSYAENVEIHESLDFLWPNRSGFLLRSCSIRSNPGGLNKIEMTPPIAYACGPVSRRDGMIPFPTKPVLASVSVRNRYRVVMWVLGAGIAYSAVSIFLRGWYRLSHRRDLHPNRRRAYRVLLTAPIFVYGRGRDEPFWENTETLNVSTIG